MKHIFLLLNPHTLGGTNIFKILLMIINFICLYSIKVKSNHKENSKMYVYLLFEYPYSCGTWFNRGKEVCNQIQETLEKNGFNIIPSIKPYHMGEFPQGYNGEFNIYLNDNGEKILLSTSDTKSQFFQKGLKSFAYTYFSTDEKTGERNYFAINPERQDLLNFTLNRVLNSLKNKKNNNNKYYYDD